MFQNRMPSFGKIIMVLLSGVITLMACPAQSMGQTELSYDKEIKALADLYTHAHAYNLIFEVKTYVVKNDIPTESNNLSIGKYIEFVEGNATPSATSRDTK